MFPHAGKLSTTAQPPTRQPTDRETATPTAAGPRRVPLPGRAPAAAPPRRGGPDPGPGRREGTGTTSRSAPQQAPTWLPGRVRQVARLRRLVRPRDPPQSPLPAPPAAVGAHAVDGAPPEFAPPAAGHPAAGHQAGGHRRDVARDPADGRVARCSGRVPAGPAHPDPWPRRPRTPGREVRADPSPCRSRRRPASRPGSAGPRAGGAVGPGRRWGGASGRHAPCT